MDELEIVEAFVVPEAALTVTDAATAAKKRIMLQNLAIYGNISRAVTAAGISRRIHYVWLEKDPDYAKDVEDALENAWDALEDEARRRAVEGWDEAVFGSVEVGVTEQIGVIRRFDGQLLKLLLQGNRPGKYRDKNTNVRHSGSVGLEAPPSVTINMLSMTAEECLAAMQERQNKIHLGLITAENDPEGKGK